MRRSFGRPLAAPYLFLLPQMVIVMLFGIYPIVYNIILSLQAANLGSANFVGFDQYAKAAKDRIFWLALRNTGVYTLAAVPLTVVSALAAAIALNQPIRGKKILRTIFLFPYLTSWVVIGLIWKWMYSVNYGVINRLLEIVGVHPINWLGNPSLTILSIVIAGVWHDAGYYMVILLAGLQSIPTTYYESACIDGANAMQRFRHITLPMLRPILFIVTVLSMVNSFKVFDQIYVMTGGGPGRASLMLVNYIYSVVIDGMDIGYGAALSVIMFLIILVLTVLQRRTFRGSESEEM